MKPVEYRFNKYNSIRRTFCVVLCIMYYVGTMIIIIREQILYARKNLPNMRLKMLKYATKYALKI